MFSLTWFQSEVKTTTCQANIIHKVTLVEADYESPPDFLTQRIS